MKKIIAALFAVLLIAVLAGCAGRQEPSPASTSGGTPATAAPALELSSPEGTEEPAPTSASKPQLTEAEIDKTAEFLYIYKRNITLFDFLADYTNLKALTIDNCTIPDGLALPAIKSLEILLVGECGPNSIELIKNNTQITELDLGANQLVNIDVLKDFHNLVRLTLMRNGISDLSALERLENLEDLCLLGGNRELTSLKPL